MEGNAIRIRPYSSEDETALRAIHAGQNLGYDWPDPSNPLMLVKLVVVDGHGNLRAALFGRVTVELVAMVDKTLTEKKKTECWRLGLKEAEDQVRALGIDELQAMIAPNMNGLGKLLTGKYGFVRDDSICFHKNFGVSGDG